MTANELRKHFNETISNLVPMNTDKVFKLHCSHTLFHKAKYSCTTDEHDFKIIGGKVYFKGFEVVAS
jgi:hypothetical protein